MKVNNKDFLEYLKNNCRSNVTFIKSIRFNKKSISLKVEDKNMIFNNMFTERTLYNIIISYLIAYIKDNNIDYPTDKDFLTYKFQKININ